MTMLIRIIPANHSVTKHSHISRVASSQTANCLDTPTPPLHHNDIITENLRGIRDYQSSAYHWQLLFWELQNYQKKVIVIREL